MPDENETEQPDPSPNEPGESVRADQADTDVQDAIEQEARVMVASLNLPEQGSIPDDRKQQICARVDELCKRHRITRAVLAKQLGGKTSEQVLCFVLKGKYTASDEDIIRRLNAWLESTERRLAAMRPAGICDTGVVRLGRSGCDFAKSHGCIVLMVGPAGIGKTSLARVYCSEDMNAVYVRLLSTHASPTGLLRLIADALRIECVRGRMYLMEAVLERLTGSNRLLVIDEWHLAQGQRKVYELVRDIFDTARVPVALIATEEVSTRVQQARLRKGKEWSDQFCSRIGWTIDLTRQRGAGGEPRPLFTEAEIREVFKSDQVRISRDGIAYLQALACSLGMGCLRTAEECFVMASRIAKRRPDAMVTARDLRKAFKQQSVPDGMDDSVLLSEIDRKLQELTLAAAG